MLLTFRLFFIAAGLALLAVVLTARGLVSQPEVHTRIGEAPSVGRSLVQQAIVPLSAFERQMIEASVRRAEEVARLRDVAAVATAPEAAASVAPAPEAAPAPVPDTSEPTVATRPDPLGDLISAILSDTPDPAPRDEEGTQTTAIARPPALAFGGELPADRASRAGAGQRTAAAPAPTALEAAASDAAPPAADSERAEAAPKDPTSASTKTDDAPKARRRRVGVRPGARSVARPSVARKAAVARPAIRKKAKVARVSRRAKRAAARSATPAEATQGFTGQPGLTYQVAPQSYPSYYSAPQTTTKVR